MAEINFKSPDFKKLTVALSGFHRSAYPSAVRGTLNRAAFDVKQRTLKTSTEQAFNDRSNFRFFKAFSGVDKATGFDVDAMSADVGLLKGVNDDIDNFAGYEGAGSSKKRSFIPIDRTRTGGNRNKKRAKRNYHTSIRNIVKTSQSSGKTQKQKLIRSAIVAGKGGHVLHNRILFRVVTLQSSIKQRRLKVRFIPVYKYNPGRVDRLRKNKFLSRASTNTAFRIGQFFEKEAEFQVKKQLQKRGL